MRFVTYDGIGLARKGYGLYEVLAMGLESAYTRTTLVLATSEAEALFMASMSGFLEPEGDERMQISVKPQSDSAVSVILPLEMRCLIIDTKEPRKT